MKICEPICSATTFVVERDRTGFWRWDAVLQTKVGGVLGGISEAAPPEDRAALDDVVEPGLAICCWSQIKRVPVIWQGAKKRESARYVVIGHNKRRTISSGQVIIDLANFLNDPVVRPTFDRSSKVDADQFAEDSRVDPLNIVCGIVFTLL